MSRNQNVNESNRTLLVETIARKNCAGKGGGKKFGIRREEKGGMKMAGEKKREQFTAKQIYSRKPKYARCRENNGNISGGGKKIAV